MTHSPLPPLYRCVDERKAPDSMLFASSVFDGRALAHAAAGLALVRGTSTLASDSRDVGVLEWTFAWTAPELGGGNITFHLAVVDGNGAESPPTVTRTDPFGDDLAVAAVRLAEGAARRARAAPRRRGEHGELVARSAGWDVSGPESATVGAVTSFVGRTRDLERIEHAIGDGQRLVTLAGPGGVGKSRLAAEAVRRWGPHFEGGAATSDLTRARTGAELSRLVLEALGETSGGGRDPVAAALSRRAPTLLVLDNLEHLLEPGVPLIERCLRTSPAHCLLVTSQISLRLQDQHLLAIEPLTPEDALSLFTARVREAAPALDVDEPLVLQTLGELAERLDRLPLAIELAAARATIMSPSEILARVEDRFALLRSRHVDRDPRHATLEDTIAWAYRLLDDELRDALAACAVFAGPFDVEAAEAVFPAAPTSAVDRVQTLVERSLLISEHTPRGVRFRLLESVRAFVTSRAHIEPARDRMAAFFVRRHAPDHAAPFDAALADASHLAAIVDRGDVDPMAAARAARALAPVVEASGTKEEHVALLRLAIEHAMATGDERTEALCRLDLARARCVIDPAEAEAQIERTRGITESLVDSERLCVSAFLARHEGRLGEAVESLTTALRTTRDRRAARVQQELAVLHMLAGRGDAAGRAYRAALDGYHAAGDERAAAEVSAHLGVLALDADDDALAREYLEAALRAHRAAGDRRREGMVLSNLGVLEHQSGTLDAAEARWTEALAVHRAIGSARFEAFASCGLGAVLQERGELTGARARIERGCEIFAGLHDPRWEGWALSRRGAIRAALGDADRAREDFVAARQRLEGSQGQAWLGAVDVLEQLVHGPRALDAPRGSAERIAWRLVRAEPITAADSTSGTLMIAENATWFECGGQRVDLSRRHATRRLLGGLLDHRLEATGEPMLTEQMVRAGWPGERMRSDSGASRVYTAVRTLRRMGLEGILVSAHGGYLLHESVAVRVIEVSA